MKTKKLIQTINDPTHAIFNALQEFDVPWKNDNVNTELDIDYLFNHSGNKITSPLIDFFINTETGKIDALSLSTLANIIFTKYGMKWNKIYDTFTFEYDPISNYDMTETMTDDETVHEFGHSNTRTDNLTENDTIETNRAGFNSSDYSPIDQSIEEITNTGTQTHLEGGSNTDTRNYTLTRSGNIGVTTSQQMIESERKLWLFDFIDRVVYPDIDKILTIQIY